MNKKLLPITFSVLFIVSCGGGGGGGSTPTTPTTPAPTVNLSAEPTSVLLENTSTLTWSSSYANACSADWTTQTGTSGSEAVTITAAGNNSFSITCTGDGGSRSASVMVEGYRNTDGVVVDGYISGAEVCIDEDESWTCDSNENSTTSDNEGKFTIRYANGNLVSIGGTDLDSQTLLDNLLITHKLTGHSDFKAVTPVTSIAAFMEDASLVNTALGIDSSIDVFTFDPVDNKGDGGINDYLYEKGNQLTVLAFALQNIANNLNTTTETTQDYFKAITEEIEKEYTETSTKVDIETEAFVTKALDNVIAAKSVTIDETAKANTAKALAGVMPVIEVKSSDDLTTGVIRFAVSTLQTDIQAIANGTATAEIVTSYTSDVLAYIAEDQNIDADEITPDISAIADSASTIEDTAAEINVLLNDSYLTSSPISVTAGNATNGTTSVVSNVVTYEPDADYNGTDTFSYTITQGDKTSSADVTVTIEAVNDEPSIDIALTIQVAENQTAVTTVSVSDVDEDELTLTLGGTDADSFNLSNENVLTFKEAPDYETKDSYSITLTLTDGTETVTRDVTVAITNVNDVAPEFTSEATFSAAENQTAIGTVTANDADGDDVTFTISGDELAITSAGVLTFKTAPDYETKTTYTATVTASDGTNSTTQDITVNITDVNEAPAFTSNATFSAAENQTAIGTVAATDVDGDTITYSISGSDITINSSSGVIAFASTPDYETKTSYTATVTASDGINSITQDITVNVTNVNEAPVFTSSATFSAAENQTAIGTVTASDAEGDVVTFTVSGSELAITSDGVLGFVSAPDYETKTSYTATVTASDGTNSTTQDITVNVTDINEAPAFTSNATFSAAENQTAIGTVAATDVDGDTITYSISGSDITINSSSGVIAFASAPDYETKTSYTATVTASDGINSITQDIAVNVTNVNDIAPVFTSNATFSVAENQTAIGTVAATDTEGDVVTFTVSGSELAITPAGVLTFTSAPDYETKTTYTATVTASDGTNSTTKDITVNVTNVNDNTPVFTSNANFSASENQTEIGTVTATDADGDGILYTISGSDITINSSSGVIAFTSAPDYETKTTYTATVTASDGLNSTTQDITVNVTNENDNSPSFTSEATFSAAENQTAIGTVMASDADGDDISYSISGSDITINSSTGVIAFASAPDYENTAVYTATVIASDGINSSSQIIEILVSNICEFDFIFYENQTVESRGEDWRSNYRYRDDMSSHSRYVRIFSANSPGDTACPQPEIFDFTIEGPDADFFELSSLEGNDYDRYYIYSTKDFDYENPLDADANNIYEYHLVGEYGGEIVKEVLTLEIKNENEYGNIESISFDQSNENIQIIFTTNHDLPTNTAYIEFGVRGPSAPLRFLSGKIPYDSSQSNYNIEFSYGDQLGTDNISPELWGGYYQINKITFYDQNEDEIESIFASRISGDVTTYVTVDSGKNFVKVKSLSGELTVEDENGVEGTRFTGLMEFENYGWVDSNSSRAAGTAFYPSLMLIAGSAPKGLNDYSGSWTFGNESNSDNGDGTFTSTINSTDLDFYTRSGKHEYRLRIRQRGYNGNYYYIYIYPQELLKFGYVDSYTTFVNNKATSEDLTGPALTYYSNLEVESCTFDNSKVYADIAMDVSYSQSTTSNPRADLTLGSSDDLYYMYSRGVQYNNGQTLRDEIQTEFTGKTREDFEVELYAVAAYDKALNYNRLEKNSNYHKAPEVRKVNLLDHCDERIITNNAPVITSDAIFAAAENQRSVGSIVVNDEDGDSISFTISQTHLSGSNGVPPRLKITQDGLLSFDDGPQDGGTIIHAMPDFERETTYKATITVSDGLFTDSQDITVNIIDVNEAPTFKHDSECTPWSTSGGFGGCYPSQFPVFQVEENKTSIGSVQAYDPEGDSLSYSISGTDAALINIDSSTGVLSFISASDYETKSSYSAIVTANDGFLTGSLDITVTVTDVNEAPAFTSSATFSAAENQTAIGTVAASDVDGDTITYSISGSDITINSSSGVIAFASAPDYETKSIYTATVTASDGTDSITQDITVNVTDVNEAPLISSPATFNAPENQTAIGTVTASDVEGDSLTFSSSFDAEDIQINSTTGVLTFTTEPNFEPNGITYGGTVYVSDGTNVTQQNISITVTDVNETPVFNSPSTYTVNENDTEIGYILDAATDPESTTLTYSVTGTDSSSISINSNNYLVFNSAPDYETKSSYTATLNASDGVFDISQDITISIVNLNDNSPEFSSSEIFSADENQTSIGTVEAADADGDSISYSISGSDINIDSSTGIISFASAPDYETKDSYSATITVTDGSFSTTQDITVNINNLNDNAPVITSSGTYNFDENYGDSLFTVNATDADNDSLTYSIDSDSGLYQKLNIGNSNGKVYFYNSSSADYETQQSFSGDLTVSDGVNVVSQTISITLNNINDNDPVISSNCTSTYLTNGDCRIPENSTDLVFYEYQVSDPDGDLNDLTVEAVARWCASSCDPDGDYTYWTIDRDNQTFSLRTSPDYEAEAFPSGNVLGIRLLVTDGENTTHEDGYRNIYIDNVNDNSPSFDSSATFSVSENQTAIGTVAASDADGDTITYSVSGTDSGSVSINSSSGVLTFNSAPNYESKTSYSIVVTASDGTNSTNQNVTINITNVNEAPAFTSSASFSAAENQTTIGSVSVTDPENATLSYSLSGTDASSLAISSSGVLSFGSAPNYESKNSYSATVAASDGTNSTTQDVTISVTDVNDAPVATAASYYMNLKPQSQTSGTLTLAGTDEDGDTLTYSIVSNGSYGTASLSGTTITYQTDASTQSAQSESFTFKVNDGTVDSSAATISISLKTDPLYQYQWHLNNTGQTNFASNAGTSGADLNVDTVISNGYTGNGVIVAVIDDGLEIAHEDLVDNIVTGSWDFVNSDQDPTGAGNVGRHGTSAAGLIAAKGWNNKGGRGVAPNASLIGYNYLESSTIGNQIKSWGIDPDVSVATDIFNMSYGTPVNSGYTIPSYLDNDRKNALINGVSNLRGGKGAIYIQSSGNDYKTNATSDCGSTNFSCTELIADSRGAVPYIMQVGSLNADGGISSYSTPGSGLWISGFGGEYGNNASYTSSGKPAMMTVDLSGCTNGYVGSNGYTQNNQFDNNSGDYSENSACNYTADFNGTSASAPTVSGVVALMLEANPDLTWRDVKHILATTADQVGSASYTYGGVVQSEWETNTAGYKFHNWYGFGKVDAAEAVSTAASYTANSRGTFVKTDLTFSPTLNQSIVPSGTRTSAINVTKPAGSNNFVEYVTVSVKFDHAVPKSVGIRLLSPGGTEVNIMQPFTTVTTNPSSVIFQIGVSSLYGEVIEGNWTIGLDDYVDDGVDGTFVYWGIEVYGN